MKHLRTLKCINPTKDWRLLYFVWYIEMLNKQYKYKDIWTKEKAKELLNIKDEAVEHKTKYQHSCIKPIIIGTMT